VDLDLDLGSGPGQLGGRLRLGLGRRGLLGGLTAGAAGLLLPGLAAAKPEAPSGWLGVRIEVANTEWAEDVPVSFWAVGKNSSTWRKAEEATLRHGERKTFWPKPSARDDEALVQVMGRIGVQAVNGPIGLPEVAILLGEDPNHARQQNTVGLKVREQTYWRVGDGRVLVIMRLPDTDRKEFRVALRWSSRGGGGRGRRPRR
jgi:hypothetical protein